MIHKSLFIFAHQIGDRNFYPIYKRLVKGQWSSYKDLKEEHHKLFDDLKLSADDVSGV